MPIPHRTRRVTRLLSAFARDRSGSYAIIVAICLPVIVGFAAVGAEAGLLMYTQRNMQHAADSAAISAAVAYSQEQSTVPLDTQADAVTASYGFVEGQNGVAVAVNQPPTSGTHTDTAGAVEVMISQNRPRIFSLIWGNRDAMPVRARAVAVAGSACVLALDPTASDAVKVWGSANVNLIRCNLNADSTNTSALDVGGSATVSTQLTGVVGGINGRDKVTGTIGVLSGYHYVADPYANANFPPFSGCDQTNYSTHGSVVLTPGVYCGGMSLGAGASVTLTPGIYYLDGGSLSMHGSASLTGAGVTLVFTSSSGSNYATADLAGGATVNLTAPTSGPTAGIALFGDRNAPVGTQFSMAGGASQSIAGAIYLPRGALKWVGGGSVTSPCTQLIGDTIQFTGSSALSINCSGTGTQAIGAAGRLVE